jgi:ribosomal protein S18 acetylase RimI-like enzyme
MGQGPIGGGTANPRADVAELTGIAKLPAFRRRGVGLSITAALVEELARRGVDVVFLSAADDDVARIYERAGFRRVAHACIAQAT